MSSRSSPKCAERAVSSSFTFCDTISLWVMSSLASYWAYNHNEWKAINFAVRTDYPITSLTTTLITNTPIVVDWCNSMREECEIWIEANSAEIGSVDANGNTIVVEIDETKYFQPQMPPWSVETRSLGIWRHRVRKWKGAFLSRFLIVAQILYNI